MSPPPHTQKDWPVLRNALTTFLDIQRPRIVQGTGEVDVTDALAAIRRRERELRIGVSFHAYLLHCFARAAYDTPGARTYRHGRKLVTFEDVDILTPVDKRLPNGVRIPVALIVRAAQRKSLAELNWELRQAVKAVDLDHQRAVQMRRRLARLPAFARRLVSWKLRRDPFLFTRLNGTIGLTSVQSHGYTRAFFALPPAIHTADYTIGNIVDRVALDASGRPVMRRILCVGGAADHDVLDGMEMARLAHLFTTYVEQCTGIDDSFVAETRRLMEGDSRAIAGAAIGS